MRVWQLSCHVKLEMLVELALVVVKSDFLYARRRIVLRIIEYMLNQWVDLIFYVFNQNGLAIAYTKLDILEEVLLPKFQDLALRTILFILILVHVLNPLVCLLLGVNAKCVPVGVHHKNSVLARCLIVWQTGNDPLFYQVLVSH